MFRIPATDTKKFSQPNYGDTQGNLWASFNLNLTKNTGRVRTTRTETIYDDTDDADLGENNAFAFFDPTSGGAPVFVAYNDKVFFGGTEPIDTFTQDALTNTPNGNGARDDLKVFNDRLYATEATKLKRLDHGDTQWDDIGTLTTGGIHQMCAYAGRLYVIDERNKISSMDYQTETLVSIGDFTLDLSYFGGHISWIAPGTNRIWIGYTKNNGTRGLIFEWDGKTENFWSQNYIIEAQGSAGCAIWNDTPYVLDIEGRLLGFNGSNFEEVARLPIQLYNVLSSGYATLSGNKICHYNGIKYMNDAIYILVNNKTTGDSRALETFPGGVYCYTKENGISHAYSPSLTKFGSATVDYGVEYIDATGAIFDATPHASNATDINATIMFGAKIDDSADSLSNRIFIDILNPATGTDEPHVQSGYFVTPFLESDQVTDVWQKIVTKYRKFLDDDAKIIVKYRTDKAIPIVLQNVVWDSNIAFTDADADLDDVVVGDEVEVLTGNGAGKVAHVLTNTDNGADRTIVLDDTVVGVTGGDISDIRFQTWKKLPPITDATVQFTDLSIPILNKDTQIQIKVVMEWLNNENELRELLIINNTEQHAK